MVLRLREFFVGRYFAWENSSPDDSLPGKIICRMILRLLEFFAGTFLPGEILRRMILRLGEFFAGRFFA
jgi:hypothetical protein